MRDRDRKVRTGDQVTLISGEKTIALSDQELHPGDCYPVPGWKDFQGFRAVVSGDDRLVDRAEVRSISSL